MIVTDFYPIFYAEDLEAETKRFTEALGFTVKHRPQIEFLDYVVLENEKKSRVDLVCSHFPADSFKEGFLGMRVNVDDFEEGTHITAVVRPEDVIFTPPSKGTIRGIVTSVIFKGIHYEITVESGKNEIVVQTVHSAKVGDRVGMTVAPDNIHIMIAEEGEQFVDVSVLIVHRHGVVHLGQTAAPIIAVIL